jgi:outer membrane protein assembly factor BamB
MRQIRTVVLAIALLYPPAFALADWSTYHGNSGLTGYTDTVIGERFQIQWRYRASASVRVTPIVADGRIFVLSGSLATALSAAGEELWQVDLGQQVEAPPVAAGDVLVIGTSAGSLLALETGTGRKLWKYDLGSRIQGSPNLVQGKKGDSVLAISQSDGILHRVNLSDGSRVWSTERTNRCDGSLAVDGGLVVYGNCDAALYIHDVDSGKRTGKVQLLKDGQVYAGVALADGTVYAGDRSGRLYAVKTQNGKFLWVSKVAGADLSSTPSVAPRIIVFGSDDGKFYAVSRKDGSLKWSLETEGRPMSPIIAGNRVLAPSDGTLYLLELSTGKILDRLELSDQITSPSLAGDLILLGTEEGYVMALKALERSGNQKP